MNIQKFESAQETLTLVASFAGIIGAVYGIDGYNLITANDLSAFGAVAYPIIIAVCGIVAITALAVKAYGYRLAKTYR